MSVEILNFFAARSIPQLGLNIFTKLVLTKNVKTLPMEKCRYRKEKQRDAV